MSPKSLIPFLTLSLLLSACGGIWEKEIEPNDVNSLAEELTDLYEWRNAGVSFRYPDSENVLKLSNNTLFINKSSEISESDETAFWTTLNFYKRATLEEKLSEQSVELEYTVTEENIGERTVTKVNTYQEFGDFTLTHYLVQTEKGVFDVKVGQNEEALAHLILETLEI